MPGRKPKPTQLRVIEGNPGRRPLNETEPKFDKPKAIRAPAHLGAEAKKEYRRVAKLLSPIGILSEADLKALELYAETYAIWKEATEKVHEVGMVVKAPSGYPQQNPYLSIANQASKRMQSLLAEFGMTPSSRSRLSTGEKGAGDFDAF